MESKNIMYKTYYVTYRFSFSTARANARTLRLSFRESAEPQLSGIPHSSGGSGVDADFHDLEVDREWTQDFHVLAMDREWTQDFPYRTSCESEEESLPCNSTIPATWKCLHPPLLQPRFAGHPLTVAQALLRPRGLRLFGLYLRAFKGHI